MNCHDCKYSRPVPGDAHISCVHPGIKTSNNPLMRALNIFFGNSINTNETETYTGPPFQITTNPHGVRNGWVIFPVNFDQIWIDSCNGFTQKNKG